MKLEVKRMARMKNVCTVKDKDGSECGAVIDMPKDFRKNKVADPRLAHLKEKHDVTWEKGIYDKYFRCGAAPEPSKPTKEEKKTETKQKLKEKTQTLQKKEKELKVIKNRINGNTAILKANAPKHA
jgi:hypothetical protein